MIRVTFPDGTTADLPEETPCDAHSADPPPLASMRDEGVVVLVERAGRWEFAGVESWEEEARRLRTERDAEKARADAAEKKLAALRAWADNARHWTQVATARSLGDVFDILNAKETP